MCVYRVSIRVLSEVKTVGSVLTEGLEQFLEPSVCNIETYYGQRQQHEKSFGFAIYTSANPQ